ncbi:diguanylate cyclase [Cohnella lubricantis]|uniref:Diguanylate cyclase n=1 Tax=Cohnella lubricantis TaxID=2163172 RepID=A0A841TFG6_9BACL|nr:diguanylate cyclase [Cohnella lubricantis]
MGLLWPDLLLFISLFILFACVIAFNRLTLTHKLYLAFHFLMMLWPLGQLAANITDYPHYQNFFIQLSFVAVGLIGPGWLCFVLFLTQRSSMLKPARLAAMLAPALVCIAGVIWNPNHLFFEMLAGDQPMRKYGPLFWVLSIVQYAYLFFTLIQMFHELKNDTSVHRRKQLATTLIGMFVLSGFSMLDLLVNVLLKDYLPVVPGLMSLGILLSDICFILAIYRFGMFDILSMAQQDIFEHMTMGIVVVDDNGKVLEANRGSGSFANVTKGDHFEMEKFLASLHSQEGVGEFLYRYRHYPQERLQTELTLHDQRHVSIQISPVLDHTKAVLGRIITFHDVTELRKLVDEMNRKNEALHERNLELITIQDELYRVNQKLEQMAITDSLTGCYNRRFLMQQLEHEVLLNLRYRIPFSIFLFDIDFFKHVNDRYGHLAGDEVIRRTAEIVKSQLRRTDILARYGGEEFTVYLPHTNREQAEHLAERIMAAVFDNRIDSEQEQIGITISMGIVTEDNFDQQVDDVKEYLRGLFSSVDAALYKAKDEGRNRAVIAQVN